jgi:hypothetical protein
MSELETILINIKKINQRKIISSIKSERFLPDNLTISSPEKVYVKRLSQTVKAENLKAIVNSYLQKKLNTKHFHFQILRVTGLEPYPVGEIIYRIKGRKIAAKMTLSVDVIINDQKINTIYIKANIKHFKGIICAGKKITKGEIITSQNIQKALKDIFKIRGEYITEKNNIIGSVAQKQISQGAVIVKKYLSPPLLIRV